VQRVVELLYDQIVQSGAFATDLVAAHFRRDRQLGSKDRNAASTVFYEILRFQRLLSFALESGTGSKGHRSPGGRELYLAWLVINEHLPPAEAAALVPHVDWYQVRGYQGHLASVMDPVARLGITQSVPDWLAAVFLEEYPGEAEELLSALNRRAPLTLRTNTLRTDAQQLAMRLAKEGCETVPCELAQNGLRLKRNTNVFSLSAFKDGWFEVQDEASQLIADLVAPPPGRHHRGCVRRGRREDPGPVRPAGESWTNRGCGSPSGTAG
jgi:16S rRNA (cytosine967-C5)-methyltransferase